MPDGLESFLIAAAGLGLLLLIALALTLSRPSIRSDPSLVARFTWLAGGAVAAQAAHFGEELLAGFAIEFPLALGLSPWNPLFFVAFNLTWLVIWLFAIPAVRAGLVVALVPLWFLGIAGAANCLAHPLLALRSGGYFPGLVTAPIVGVMGGLLVHSLWRLTEPKS